MILFAQSFLLCRFLSVHSSRPRNSCIIEIFSNDDACCLRNNWHSTLALFLNALISFRLYHIVALSDEVILKVGFPLEITFGLAEKRTDLHMLIEQWYFLYLSCNSLVVRSYEFKIEQPTLQLWINCFLNVVWQIEIMRKRDGLFNQKSSRREDMTWAISGVFVQQNLITYLLRFYIADVFAT